MEVTRHFTASTFVVHHNQVLLLWHSKLHCWLPAGGHIERDELPEIAALREVKEETGLDVVLVNPETFTLPANDQAQLLIKPMHVLLENINPFHQHIDFIYYATTDTFALNPQIGETNKLQWFTAKMVEETRDMPLNVKVCAQEAIAFCGA